MTEICHFHGGLVNNTICLPTSPGFNSWALKASLTKAELNLHNYICYYRIHFMYIYRNCFLLLLTLFAQILKAGRRPLNKRWEYKRTGGGKWRKEEEEGGREAGGGG